MVAFSCIIFTILLLNLASCDVSHTIDSSGKNVKSSPIKSNYYQGYEYSGSYSSVAPEYKAQFFTPEATRSNYDSYQPGQVESDRKYYSAKQEYNSELKNAHDSGVILISKELQVPKSDDGCEDTHNSNLNQDDESPKKVFKTSNYEVRRPGIRKEFYDILEKVVVKPAGSVVFELLPHKPHSAAIVNKHISQQQSFAKQSYPQQSSDDAAYYPQQQPFVYNRANHAYHPFFIHSVPAAHNPGYDYNPVQTPETPQYTPYTPHNYNPVFPSTTVTPEYIPPISEVPLCDNGSSQYPPSTPQPPQQDPPKHKPHHELNEDDEEDEHDYDSDAVIISPQRSKVSDGKKQFVDVVYAQNQPNSDREFEDYPIRGREEYKKRVTSNKEKENYQQQAYSNRQQENYRQQTYPIRDSDQQQYALNVERENYQQQTYNNQEREDYRQQAYRNQYPDDYQQQIYSKGEKQNYQQQTSPSRESVDYQQETYVNRDKEDYRQNDSPTIDYSSAYQIDRVRNEYQNQRGDLAQQKLNPYPQQFHQEYVPNANQKQVQIRPNGAPLAKYTDGKAASQAEIENSRRLIDLYSANGDVTEIGNGKSQRYQIPNKNVQARVITVTPAPYNADYVDEETKSRRVVLSKPLYTVQNVEVREHSQRLVEDLEHEGVEPKISEFEKLQLIGRSSSDRQEVNKEAEYVTPVPQEFAHLRAGSPVPENLQK